jgi:hypothetical protein
MPSGQRKLRWRLDGRRQRDSIRGQDDGVLRGRLHGRWQWHAVGGLHNPEFRRRLNRRGQRHTVCDMAISPTDFACQPVVDRNSYGKYDKAY